MEYFDTMYGMGGIKKKKQKKNYHKKNIWEARYDLQIFAHADSYALIRAQNLKTVNKWCPELFRTLLKYLNWNIVMPENLCMRKMNNIIMLDSRSSLWEFRSQ